MGESLFSPGRSAGQPSFNAPLRGQRPPGLRAPHAAPSPFPVPGACWGLSPAPPSTWGQVLPGSRQRLLSPGCLACAT